jgi:catechol 2,3-dioxygenase-like lactoylglutathione lyase family enzyme
MAGSSLVRAALFVEDLVRSRMFYEGVLGLTEVYFEGALDPASTARVLSVPLETRTACCILKRPGTPNFGMIGLFELTGPALQPVPPAPSLTPRAGETALVFYIDDVETALTRARGLGARMVGVAKPFDMAHRPTANLEACLRDPDGVLVNLIGRNPDEQFADQPVSRQAS